MCIRDRTFSVLEYPHKRESVGKPLPGMQVRIDNSDTDGVGEIHLTGPMVMTGYINKEPIDGDFNTDDIGYIDEDGFVSVSYTHLDVYKRQFWMRYDKFPNP